MYDLSINVYNYIASDNDGMMYYILTKNSNMEKFSIQLVSDPVDEQLAKELRGELEVEETPGGENVEISPEDLEDSETGDNEE